ncbi:Sulfotransferase family protein [Verrucomicrobium sp. GAS474]|uniref:sulfotransferase family protein n=1 Tax=Verrucomicrobium sp. GAS474 TaxID=1882831 RepID=UPI000879ADB5|nr:sulfotransferase [Verrucomicrobium sp. GAS474]SDT86173.1 Sulfotransferase family protein [Verrucomicrobium sp. GAS474]
MSLLEEKQFIFVVGSPRSGTTWFQYLIGSHPQVASTFELTMFESYLNSWRYHWKEEQEQGVVSSISRGLAHLWREEQFDAFLREFLERCYASVLEGKPAASAILDKSPDNALHMPMIAHFLPKAKFIHIIRDGRDVVSSMVAANRSMHFGAGTVPQAAAEWVRYVRACREAGARPEIAPRYAEVRYEALLRDGAGELRRVFDFLGLPTTDAEIAAFLEANRIDSLRKKATDSKAAYPAQHYRRGKAEGWRDDFNIFRRGQIDAAAGGLLCELGYAAPGWWGNALSRCAVSLAVRLKLRLRKEALHMGYRFMNLSSKL